MVKGAYDMSDHYDVNAKCPYFKYTKKNTIFCHRTKPIVFETRQEMNDFMEQRCNHMHNTCQHNSQREKCCMENTIGTGRHVCSAYKIECHRDTCPYYKSEHDKELAAVKTRERLLSLPAQQRRDIEEKYGLCKKKRGFE